MVVAIHLPPRRGIGEVDVALHQFGEGGLGMGPGKRGQQFGVGRHFQLIAPAELNAEKNRI